MGRGAEVFLCCPLHRSQAVMGPISYSLCFEFQDVPDSSEHESLILRSQMMYVQHCSTLTTVTVITPNSRSGLLNSDTALGKGPGTLCKVKPRVALTCSLCMPHFLQLKGLCMAGPWQKGLGSPSPLPRNF